MKRGNKLLTYLFVSLFLSIGAFTFFAQKVGAANEIVCYDRGNNGECSASTQDAYFVIERYEVLESETDLTFPDTAEYLGTTYNIEEIESNAIVVVDSAGNEVNSKLVLNNLALPDNLLTLHDNSLASISSLELLKLPNTLMSVGTKIFDDAAEVKQIELNHYDVLYSTAGGIMKRAISFMPDSLSNAKVGRFICSSLDIYDNIISNVVGYGDLQNVNVTAELTYLFYESEKSIVDNDAPIDSIKYYIGEVLVDLPQMANVPTGLDMMGWYWESNMLVEDGTSTVIYQKNVSTYKIYPKFELIPLSFDINVNQLNTRYTAETNLVVMNPFRISHDLLNNPEFDYKIKWTKAGRDIASNDGKLTLWNVNESGVYVCTINYSYSYEGILYSESTTREQEIIILPAFLYVEVSDVSSVYGTYLTDAELSYTHAGLLGNDRIATSTYTYHKTGDIQVGVYLNEIELLVQSILNEDDLNVTTNYNIIYKYGNHTVTKKDLGRIVYNGAETFYYGEEAIARKVMSDEGVYGQYENDIIITFSRENGSGIGRYYVDGIVEIDNPNYTASFNTESVGYIDVFAKEVSANYTLSANVYDGKEKRLNVYYLDIKSVPVSVEAKVYLDGELVDSIVNAGTYSVVVEGVADRNYSISNGNAITFTIAKATPVVRYATNQEFIYTGETIRPVITINNSEQTPTYACINSQGAQGDYCQDVGVYTVNVNYAETTNYLAYSTMNSQPIRMNISKYSVNLNPKSFNTYYGESPNLEEKITINGEEMIVKYSSTADENSFIGTYDIVRAVVYHISGDYEHPNYAGKILLAECTDKVKVVPRPITLHYYDYSDLVYDGKEKIIGAYLFDTIDNVIIRDLKITSVVDEGVVKNAGTYHISSSINDEKYVIVNSTLLEFEVSKGTYDVSNLKFDDVKFVLDFKMHSVEIIGDLPEGVKVTYTVNGREGNSAAAGFENVVVANFEVDTNNYNPIESMSAVIVIDMSWLIIVVISIIIAAGVGICGALLYASYRRDHPRKIKLKIKNVIHEDLAAKRVATSVKEVLGDEEEKKKLDKEIAILESEDDLDDAVDSQTFIERIYAADSELKYYYSEVKNELLSYEGITHSIDRKFEIFYHGTKQIAKLSICNGILRLYVDLEPQKYDKRQYNQRDMSNFKCHEKTPLRINVNSLETLRHAKVFIRIIRKKEKLDAVSGFVRIDYEKFYTLKENFFPKMFKNVFTKDSKNKDKKN
ncbi:MAG: hypothetical protein IKJ30_04330 [Bacilli bacterium]|nr:hypothetical protein [Bacilli bacterium]